MVRWHFVWAAVTLVAASACIEPVDLRDPERAGDRDGGVTCAELDCGADHRVCEGFEASAYYVDADRCGGCVTGFHDQQGACLPDTCGSLDCVGLNRACLYEEGPVVCGPCLPGALEIDDLCVSQNCADLDCAARGMRCSWMGGGAVCFGCIEGYHGVSADMCLPDTCADLNCDWLHRDCVERPDGSVCTSCAEGYIDNPNGGRCIPTTCKLLDCEAELRICDTTTVRIHCGACAPGAWEVDGACVECEVAGDCAAGSHCAAGRCITECTADGDCDVADCSPFGRCIPRGATWSLAGCGGALLEEQHQPPRVTLMVDRSEDMRDMATADQTWWELFGTELFGDTSGNAGVLAPREGRVEFGATSFADDAAGGPTYCPQLDMIWPALDNVDALAAAHDLGAVVGARPTAAALDIVVSANLGRVAAERHIMLVVSGPPAQCVDLEPSPAADQALLNAIGHAADDGIAVHVVGVGDQLNAATLSDLMLRARATVQPSGTPPPHAYLTDNAAQVRPILDELMTALDPCSIWVDTYEPFGGVEVFFDGDVIADATLEPWHPGFLVGLPPRACAAWMDGSKHVLAARVSWCGE